MGIALLGAAGTATYRVQVRDAIPADTPREAAGAAQDSIGAAVVAATGHPGTIGDALIEAARSAFTQGFQLAYGAGAVLTVGIALLAVTSLRTSAPGLDEEDTTAS
ncbi:hypothetical protein E1265_24935 [Streptomyces sp. 8K308]|uniref:hypothetical protein n=1 Tax=Streptomyces sp. 8K308 TaxID=2530388 RepID=UPI0010462FDE|nr:hypothetical protein [Streptomyces sp. 8K308]TDC18632.1 hypothetical protein E1265_24935 [Streptomyces sp. 8K308]